MANDHEDHGCGKIAGSNNSGSSGTSADDDGDVDINQGSGDGPRVAVRRFKSRRLELLNLPHTQAVDSLHAAPKTIT